VKDSAGFLPSGVGSELTKKGLGTGGENYLQGLQGLEEKIALGASLTGDYSRPQGVCKKATH